MITTGAISISEMININHTLQLLYISGNPIGDEGIAAIATNMKNSIIRTLGVWDCKITMTGAASLARGVVNNNTLKSLVAWGNDITMNGAIAILEAAVSNNVCEVVEIDDEYESDDKVKEMMSILKERKRREVARKHYCLIIITSYYHNNRIVKRKVMIDMLLCQQKITIETLQLRYMDLL